jgi:hypothetical protein
MPPGIERHSLADEHERLRTALAAAVLECDEAGLFARALRHGEQAVHTLRSHLLAVEYRDLQLQSIRDLTRTLRDECRCRDVARPLLKVARDVRATCRDGAVTDRTIELVQFAVVMRQDRDGFERRAGCTVLGLRLQVAVVPRRENGRLDGSQTCIVVAHVLAEMVHVTDRYAHLADRHLLRSPHRRTDRTTQSLDRVILPLARTDEQHATDAALGVRRIHHHRVGGLPGEVAAGQHATERAVVETVDLGNEPRRTGVALENVQDEELRRQLIDGYPCGRDRRFSHGRCQDRCSMGDVVRSVGPTYSAFGRISRLSESCSFTCAVQPAIRAHANRFVNRSIGIPSV